jgi:indole-3-glycerol phosphate synthase
VNRLEPIIAATREEVARRRENVTLASLERVAAEHREGIRDFAAALSGSGVSVIAEHKRRSPSAGVIRDGMAIEDVVAAYERGGAAALSILTDAPSFGGSLDDLRATRATTTVPILRKDFIVDPYQVPESLAAGADAVLLIVAALSEPELEGLHREARALGLSALVEVHDERELEAAVAIGAELVGINNRDLVTLAVDRSRTFELLPHVPAGATVVAESGFSTRAELDELERAGIAGVLIGEALMRAPEIERAVRELSATSVRPPV